MVTTTPTPQPVLTDKQKAFDEIFGNDLSNRLNDVNRRAFGLGWRAAYESKLRASQPSPESGLAWIEWVEPFGPNNEPVFFRVPPETAIAVQKATAKQANPDFVYPSDQAALDDFIVVHWATRVPSPVAVAQPVALTFDMFRAANAARCVKWHPAGIASWSPSDWLTAVTGELGELASLLKMRNRERDGLPGNKFSPTQKQIADELADVLTYLDLLAEVLGVNLGQAAVEKFNEISERVGFPDRIILGK